jgi:hypothetical protein
MIAGRSDIRHEIAMIIRSPMAAASTIAAEKLCSLMPVHQGRR